MSFRKLLLKNPIVKKGIKWFYIRLGSVIGNFIPKVKLSPGVSLSRYFTDNDLFFGYYDLNPIHNNRLLAHEIRSDLVHLLSIDLETGDFQNIAKTTAWNYQQGARLGWCRNNENQVYYNTLSSNSIQTNLVDLENKQRQVFATPLQVANDNFDSIISVNIAQINKYNPEYGYKIETRDEDQLSQNDSQGCGLFLYDMHTSMNHCLIPLEMILCHDSCEGATPTNSEINHVTYSPDESHLAFIHRWYLKGGKRKSRLLIYDIESKLMTTVLANGMVSHYCWQDKDNIFVYGCARNGQDCFMTYHILTHSTTTHTALSGRGDGHPSVSPDKEWIVLDTYPGISRHQHLYHYNVVTKEVKTVGSFYSPRKYSNAQRCDLHPRWSTDGQIVIDTTHTGKREICLIDVSSIL